MSTLKSLESSVSHKRCVERMTSPIPQVDLLVLLAVTAEREALEQTMKSRGLQFQRKQSPLGRYYDLGKVGDERVIAVRAAGMGPFGRQGSADLAMRYQQATAATAIVQLGMAFGSDPNRQNYGDVLVSSSLIPYDNRDYIQQGQSGYEVNYSRAKPVQAGPMLSRFRNEAEQDRTERGFAVHIGAMLSGAARIHSETFRNELVDYFASLGVGPIVGGEMEAIGLLGVDESPIWCVVKGIFDFADSGRDSVIATTRPIACANAAEFLVSTLLNPPMMDTI